MNRWAATQLPATLLLMVVAVGCSGESEQSRYRAAIPTAGEFERVEVSFATPLAAPVKLDADMDAAEVGQILASLGEARVAGISSSESTATPFRASPIAHFRSTAGDRLSVALAYDCTTTELGQHCRTHPRHVVVRHGEDAWRVVSPELAEWLSSQLP